MAKASTGTTKKQATASKPAKGKKASAAAEAPGNSKASPKKSKSAESDGVLATVTNVAKETTDATASAIVIAPRLVHPQRRPTAMAAAIAMGNTTANWPWGGTC